MKRYLLGIVLSLCCLGACISDNSKKGENNTDSTAKKDEQTKSTEVNVYSHRHYDTDKALFKKFTEKTGIKVNVVKASADELINKLEMEGENSPADVFV